MLTNWNTCQTRVFKVFGIYPGDKNTLPSLGSSFGSTFDLHWMIRMGMRVSISDHSNYR